MKRLLTYSFILSILLASCEKRTGEIVTEQRTIGDFNEIVINDIFNIYINQDTSTNLRIEGGENILPKITTKIKDGVLTIDNENSLRWSRDYDRVIIWITVKDLDKIEYLEPACVETTDTIHGKNLTIYALAGMNEGSFLLDYDFINFGSSHSTGGKIDLAGRVNSIRIECYNSLHLDAENLSANNVDAMNKSIGDVYVQCQDELKVRIYNDGNIYYSGEPDSIIMEIEGDGRLIEME